MSDENPIVEEVQPTVEELSEQLKQFQEKVSQLTSTNERLLTESKQNKEKYQSVKAETEREKEERLRAEGKWKEALEITENKLFEKDKSIKQVKQAALSKEINFQVAKYASNAHDLGVILNSLDRNILSINEDDLNVSGVEDAVNKLREEKPFLFKTKVETGMVESRPNGGMPKSAPKTELEIMEDYVNNIGKN